MPSGSGPTREEIDYEALKRELVQMAEQLVSEWLPGGEKIGGEWKCADLAGGHGHSCSVNLSTGAWGDFAHEDELRGKDLISLYAAKHGMKQWEAARELIDAHHLGHCIVRVNARPGASGASAEARPAVMRKQSAEGGPQKGEFIPVVPVPDTAGPRPESHPYRGIPERIWHYTRDGKSLGYVYRFRRSDGGKEVLPLTWCVSQINGLAKWTWKTWADPRPVYLASGTLRPGVTRLVVEGEKCADAGHEVLGDEYDVLSWPGGGKAVTHADWQAVVDLDRAAGKEPRFTLWPDADYKRRKPSAEEKAAGWSDDDPRLDYLPEEKQPGASAMRKLARILADLGAQVWICPLPAVPARAEIPPPVPDGWDIADAIGDGWDAERCRQHLRGAVRWTSTPSDDSGGQRSARAGHEGGGNEPGAWRSGLIRSSEGAIKAVRENVVLALQEIPEVRGKICFNEFTNDIIKLAPMPWKSPAGKWSEVDELLMGEWLCRDHYLPSMPRTTLEEGMRMVATRHQYHPVRQYIRGLRWDGTARLNDWLIQAVVDNPDRLGRRERSYLRRVGAWFLMGMVARAMTPGCKFDYMPILEGPQGMRKSTVLAVLAGEWFADTGFVLGDKDSLQMLQGRWLYEISELDAMARAEVTKIKAFIASRSDWYRASFDKRPREYPRQLIFAGTTNEHQYLVDGTGNRRFWPIEVTRQIDTDWVASVRDQLFAEAWVRVEKGERFYPLQQEELELFLPQQRARMVESPIEVRLLDYLVNHADGALLSQVQIVTLLAAIGIDITKLGPGRFHEKQAGTALRKFGWERKRSSAAGRPWVYVKPDGWPACMNLDDLDEPPAAAAPSAPPSTAGVRGAGRADYDDTGVAPGSSIKEEDDVPY